ncbi:hypothetical protein EMIHUDRAFT_450067 [Emiliania huxleyi CCMP1516]|uniref:Mitochondrial carrier protein n=2 Tax=Emiliania huxleyi TaxID=2903 RepID=A0A0D3JW30_EMIH1|nr:hypothetical protein EMIHUDRAFT_450067 [Emiliania huxleyi CCMP1516]EOD27715.1 hypothetical protein EMIHUDRAFT_450067 [Emiliania huxleyi CCMP1516]|eukprot:XP_005780144.1 hypothetical protein EMIHUDRAFT_450067 [Emiliania huxleyi CCMP1516]
MTLLTLALLLPPLAAASLTGERRRGPSLPSPPRLADVPNSVRHVLASAASGAVGVTTLAPLEVMRVNMMVSGRGWSLRRAFASLEGGWYRGNSADVLAAAIRVGITMPAFATYKRLLQRASEEGSSSSPPPEWTVARTRIAVACDVRLGVLGCLASVVREEGPLALYAGLLTTLAGVLPFNALKLAAYDRLRTKAATLQDPARNGRPDLDATSVPVPLVAAIGAASGCFAATSCFPIEVVRRRQMAGEFVGLGPLSAVVAIARTEGARALTQGVGLNCVKVAMSNSLGFVFYELAMDVLRVNGRQPPWARSDRFPLPSLLGLKPAVSGE